MSMTPAELAGRLARGEIDLSRTMKRVVVTIERRTKRRTPVAKRLGGTLRRSITHRVESSGARGVVGTNVDYAMHVYFGTKAHIIRPKNKKMLYWKGARHPARVVNHPGTRAQPFLDWGLEDSRAEIDAILADTGLKLFTEIAR